MRDYCEIPGDMLYRVRITKYVRGRDVRTACKRVVAFRGAAWSRPSGREGRPPGGISLVKHNLSLGNQDKCEPVRVLMSSAVRYVQGTLVILMGFVGTTHIV